MPDAAFAITLSVARYVFLAEDQILLVIHRDVVAGVFAEQDPVPRLHVQRYALSFFDLSRPDGDHFAFLRFLFGRVRNDDAAFRRLLLLRVV